MIKTPAFADRGRLLPIGGRLTGELETLDALLVVVVTRALAVDQAINEGMWRTWMILALREAEQDARAAAATALQKAPTDKADLRADIQRRSAGLDAFMAKYLLSPSSEQ